MNREKTLNIIRIVTSHKGGAISCERAAGAFTRHLPPVFENLLRIIVSFFISIGVPSIMAYILNAEGPLGYLLLIIGIINILFVLKYFVLSQRVGLGTPSSLSIDKSPYIIFPKIYKSIRA